MDIDIDIEDILLTCIFVDCGRKSWRNTWREPNQTQGKTCKLHTGRFWDARHLLAEATVITTAAFFDKGNVNIWLYMQLGLNMFEMSCNLFEFWFVFMFIFRWYVSQASTPIRGNVHDSNLQQEIQWQTEADQAHQQFSHHIFHLLYIPHICCWCQLINRLFLIRLTKKMRYLF